MSAIELHLLLNHVPPVGALVGLLLLAAGLGDGRGGLDRAGLGVLFLASLASLPVFLSGGPAEKAGEAILGASRPFIEAHEDAARAALAGCLALAGLSLAGLVRFRARAIPRRFGLAALALALLAAGLLLWTARLGGEIRHSEIRGATAPAAGDGGASGRGGR
jgi:hypothetical protein